MSKSRFNAHPHCIYNIKAHLVLVTAYRAKAITKEILDDIEKHVRRVCKMSDVKVLEFSGEPDHVHVLLELHPGVMPTKLINSIKTVTSRLVRRDHAGHLKKHFWSGRFWSRSYCLISVGDGATTDIVRRYIEDQKRPT